MAVEMIVCTECGSNECLLTTEDFLLNAVPYEGTVTGSGETHAKVTGHVDLISLFTIGSMVR